METYFQDGSLRSVTGTAVSPVRYEYGVDLFGGAQRSYTLEIKLDDLAGRLTAQTNALGAVTRADYLTDAEGQSVTVTTQPDGGTRVETYFQDGSLRSVTGTAVSPVRYEYGVDLFGGAQRSYTLEIKLDTEGKDTAEWTKSFTDGQGRTIAVVHPDGAQQTSEYNAQGQLVRSTDPDGVVTLRAYNALGEQEYSAVDVNRNGQIDLAGPDRVSRTVRDYSEREGLAVERVRLYMWPEMGQAEPVLASTRETALNAQRAHLSWATQHGLTTESRTEFLGGGARVSTTTAPDGSRNVSIHQEGRL